MATLIEVHNDYYVSSITGEGYWGLRWIVEDLMGYEDGIHPNCFPATFVMYRAYINGDGPYGLYGGEYDFMGYGCVGAITASQAFGPVGGVPAGIYEVELKECQCHIDGWEYPLPYPYDYDDVVIDSEASIGVETVVVGLPDAPSNPIPANGAINIIWDAILKWTGDTGITGPFIYSYPFWTNEVEEWYFDCLHTVYFSKSLAQLTAIRRAYSWTDDEYELRNPNPQYFNLNDYNYVLPYPTSPVKIYWQIKTTNEWGTTWGDVWSFTTAKEGYVPPPDALPDFPPSRPDDYNPDLPWLPGEWNGTYIPPEWGEPTDYVATGGGRWGRNLVVAGNKKIYYEAFEGI